MTAYEPKHAADPADIARAADALTRARRYQPRHAEKPPFTVTRGGMERRDLRLLPIVGPQSPGEAW